MDINPNVRIPTCAQIDRACRLYSSGADWYDFCEAFKGTLPPHAIVTSWHAAKAAHSVDVKFPVPV